MPKITFVDFSGNEQVIEANIGVSLMRNAIDHDVPGIDAECGGACACATCHVYIDGIVAANSDGPGEIEESMLEFVDDLRQSSRLSCQILVTETMDGARIGTPERQK